MRQIGNEFNVMVFSKRLGGCINKLRKKNLKANLIGQLADAAYGE